MCVCLCVCILTQECYFVCDAQRATFGIQFSPSTMGSRLDRTQVLMLASQVHLRTEPSPWPVNFVSLNPVSLFEGDSSLGSVL